MVTALGFAIIGVAVTLAYFAMKTAVSGFEPGAVAVVMLVLTMATAAALAWVGHGVAVAHHAGDLGDALAALVGSLVALVGVTAMVFVVQWLQDLFYTPPPTDTTCRRCGEGLYAHRGQRFVRYHSNAGHLCPESFWQPGKRLHDPVEVVHAS